MNPYRFEREEESLLALRRTLWQLACLGAVAAIALHGVVALWCVLLPVSALGVHYRRALYWRACTRKHYATPCR